MACITVLGLGALFVSRAVTANPGEEMPTAPAPPKEELATTPATPAAATPSAAPIPEDAASREASWREAREATIRVQQRLRAEQQARKSVQQEAAKNERCVGGQRMKRVENGWVQAGNC